MSGLNRLALKPDLKDRSFAWFAVDVYPAAVKQYYLIGYCKSQSGSFGLAGTRDGGA